MSKERSVVEDGNAPDRIGPTTDGSPHPLTDVEPGESGGLDERVIELERELERLERRHYRVIEHYEHLLADAREEPSRDGYLARLRSLR